MSTEAKSHRTNIAYVLFLSISAALGGFLFGFDSGVINGTIGALQKAFNASDFGTGLSVASMILGCAAGAFGAGTIADKFGRKPIMIASAVFFIISAIGSGIAQSSTEFVVYRVLGGLAVGAASVIAPAYICEVAPARQRGALASLQQLGIVVGLFTAFLSNYLIAGRAGGASDLFALGYQAWSWMFWAETAPAFLFLIASCIIPESPRYLVAAGKLAAAGSVLARIMPDIDVSAEVNEIRESVNRERKPRFSDLIDPSTRRVFTIVFVGIGVAVFQQAVGINVIMYYGTVLWKAAGFTEAHALMINVIGGGLNTVCTIVAMFLVDRVGRRRMLLMGSVGMFVTLLIVALVFSGASLDADGYLVLSGAQGVVALLAANLFIASFAITWGPVTWVLLGEMFSNRIRGVAMAIAAMALWVTNFVITVTFPICLAQFGLGGAYIIYTAFAGLSFFFVLRFVSETKGKTLEEMKDR
jgi:SP family sugar:H+ symporter-like MFS transporter